MNYDTELCDDREIKSDKFVIGHVHNKTGIEENWLHTNKMMFHFKTNWY